MPLRRAAVRLFLFLFAAATLGAAAAQSAAAAAADASGASGTAATTTGTAATTGTTAPTSSPASGSDQAAEPAAPDDELLHSTLPLDISTASYYDLVAWAKSLGLSDAGSAAEIRSRLYDYYKVKPPPSAAASKGTVITIERADKASYFTLENEEGDVIHASGGVVLTLKEESGAVQRIEAQDIVYDRARNSVTARGSVRFLRQTGGSTETFFGEALSANLDDWTGVFLDGKMRRAGGSSSGSDRGLTMTGETMVRRSKNVLVFDKGVISSSTADDPHYAIRAAKVWILGDNEWAISDAVFSIGNVPVLWLPFFYYPGDEIVFHPVIGYRSREGEFVQTTTYLIGKKAQSTGTTGILQMSQQGQSGPTVLKGLFLRRVDSAPGGAASSTDTLKVMADAYSGLGAYTGIAGSFAKAGNFKDISFDFGLGLSRSLFEESSGVYSPYDSAADYKSVWNESHFAGLTLPLRYGFNSSAAFKTGGLSATAAFPLFSDPYFEYDFKNRSEDMDWTSLLSSSTDTSTSPSVRTSLTQKLAFTFSAQPKTLAPWISSIDLTRLNISMSWLSKSADEGSEDSTLYGVDPNRLFFYPDAVRPFDAAVTLKGSLYQYPAAATAAKPAAESSAPALRDPWSVDTEGAAAAADGTAAAGTAAAPASSSAAAATAAAPASTTDTAAPGADALAALSSGLDGGALGVFRLPARAPDAKQGSSGDPWSGSIDWTLTPSSYLEDRYRSADWDDPSAIDFSPLYTLISYRLNATLDMKAAYRQTLATASLGFAWNDQDQTRPYLYDQGDYASTAETYRLTDYEYRSSRLGATLKLGSQPFIDNWLWSPTSLSYTLEATLYGLAFDQMTGTDSDIPSYSETYLGWNSSSITTNSATLNLGIRPWGQTQSLALTATIPPTTESYSAKLSLAAAYASLTMQDRAYRSSADQYFSFDPLTSTLGLGLAPYPVLSDTFIYDCAGGLPESNTSSLSWAGLTASLVARDSDSYSYDSDSGWVANDDSAFRLTELDLGLSETLKPPQAQGPQWSLGINAALTQNLLEFSESTLTFALTAGLKVSELLDLSFKSQNASFWRYYPDLFPGISDIGGADLWRRNIVTDLLDSFKVWDSAALHRTLFKLKSLSFKMVHDLEDWNISLEASVSPVLNSAETNYVLETTVSFLLTWKDLSMVKSKIEYDSEGISSGSSQTISY